MLFNRIDQISPGVEVETGDFQVTSHKHGNKIIVLDNAAGQAITLPAATGTGDTYKFFIRTTITSNSTTIKVPDGDHTMCGYAQVLQDGGDTEVAFETAATTDTITLNGTTTGGIKNGVLQLTDIGQDEFLVEIVQPATGTEATPFSATVA